MSKIKVLHIDDSVVVRKFVSDVINAEADMEVAGKAINGKQGLQVLPQVKPDIIVLDVEMPEMDGFETLRAIRQIDKRTPVIMFSTLTMRGASATIEALAAGASDYVAKPTQLANADQVKLFMKENLVKKIRVLCPNIAARSSVERPALSTLAKNVAPNASVAAASNRRISMSKSIDILAIGCSTGGPNALAELFQKFPENFPVPIVIVQHMPPLFTKLLAERLSAKSNVKVVEATEGMVLEKGKAYIAPGDFHMTIVNQGTQKIIKLNQNEPENSCRPAVDVLFRSVADIYADKTLAVILTGMGYDGQKSCEKLKSVGAKILAQDEATSVVWGMPGAVAKAGLADNVLALNDIMPEIVRITSFGRSFASANPASSTIVNKPLVTGI